MASTGDTWRRMLAGLALLLTTGCLASSSAAPVVEKVGVVLGPSASGWDSATVESPTVVRDGDRWAMAYTGYGGDPMRGGIGLAYSDDATHWRKAGRILPDATGPVLYRDGDRWVLYYIGLTEAGYEQGHKTIRYATARHLEGPWKTRGELVAPDGTGWDAEAVWHVSVVQDGDSWFMFFNATGEDDRERIGYATGPSLVGPWTVSPDPLIEPHGRERIVGDPAVRRQGGGWVMTYYVFDGDHAWDVEATTGAAAFPAGWSDPQTVVAPSEDYDARYAHKPWIVRDGGRLLHYYTAVSDAGERQIALALR